MRRIAIGDIHGCAKALRTLIETIDPSQEDELIFLGDYIDRGPDSRNVVDQLLELQSRCRLVALSGNHELMMLTIINRGLDDAIWMANGGRATVTSYGGSLSKIPNSHLAFFTKLRPFYESHDTICVHAGYNPALPMDQQEAADLYWNHLPTPLPPPHVSGKRVFTGHTPQAFGDILDGGHLVCIDTYCFGGGYLTAFDLDSDDLIQVNHHGHLRRKTGAELAKRMRRMRLRFWDFARRGFNKVSESKSNRETGGESLSLGSVSNPKQA